MAANRYLLTPCLSDLVCLPSQIGSVYMNALDALADTSAIIGPTSSSKTIS